MRSAAIGRVFRCRARGGHGDGLGWAGTKNGELLRLAADHGFEAFVTVDVGLYVPPDARLSVLVLRAGSNRLQALVPLMPRVLEQLAALPPGRTEIIAARPPA